MGGLLRQHMEPRELEKAYSTAEAITAQTPVYRLRCTPDEKAVDALYCELYGAR